MTSLSVTYHLTHHCNLRCSYCYTGDKLPLGMSYGTIDQSVAFLQAEMRRTGCEQLHLTFFGGEPLIEVEKIFYIIEAFSQAEGLEAVRQQVLQNLEKQVKLYIRWARSQMGG